MRKSSRSGRTLILCAALAASLFLISDGNSGPSPLDRLSTGSAARPHATLPVAQPRVLNPADLSAAEAERVYQAILREMQSAYARSDDPVAWAYANWHRFNEKPYRSSRHGEAFVNVYGNEAAEAWQPGSGPMPVGALVAKDSFVVTQDETIRVGALALMEKMPPGYDPENGDWRYLLIDSEGRLSGVTAGSAPDPAVRHCAACHGTAPSGQDHLFLVPAHLRRAGG